MVVLWLRFRDLNMGHAVWILRDNCTLRPRYEFSLRVRAGFHCRSRVGFAFKQLSRSTFFTPETMAYSVEAYGAALGRVNSFVFDYSYGVKAVVTLIFSTAVS